MVAAYDRMAVGARRLQSREMIFGMNFKPVLPNGKVARGMERQREHVVTVAPAFDQSAALARIGAPRMALDPRPEFARQRQSYFSAAALTCPTR